MFVVVDIVGGGDRWSIKKGIANVGTTKED
jgi:hypothetical protein